MGEYTEPTNEQLANFLMVYAKEFLGEHNLQLNRDILEKLLDGNPVYRASALKRHKEFCDAASESFKKMQQGKLRCAHIRDGGKKCPNFNEPGSFYCGLHKELHQAD